MVDTDTVRLAYDLSNHTGPFAVEFRSGIEDVETTGFDSAGGTAAWDESTPTATVTYAVGSAGEEGDGWLFSRAPDHSAVVGFSSPDGVVSREGLMLGSFDTYARTADCQTVRVLVPTDLRTAVPPTEALDAVADAAGLETGHAPDRVTLFVLGANSDIASRYFGQGDSAIEADTELASVEHPWVHEYVHTSQRFAEDDDALVMGPEMEWFPEATAEYYAARIAFEQGYITASEYNDELAKPSATSDAVLAEPDTWGRLTEYNKGARTMAALDRDIREETNGTRSLADVFRRVNAERGTVTYAEFVSIVESVSGTSYAEWCEGYVRTDAVAPAATLTEEDRRGSNSGPG